MFELDLESYQGVALGFVVGLITMKYFHQEEDDDSEYSSLDSDWEPSDDLSESDLDKDPMTKVSGPVKMVIGVRTDLKMGKGKICAQVGHGVLSAGLRAASKHKTIFNRYRWNGQKKVCVKINSEDELLLCHAKAQSLGLISQIIADAGHTQIVPGSKTVCAILGPESLVNQVTGEYKLL